MIWTVTVTIGVCITISFMPVSNHLEKMLKYSNEDHGEKELLERSIDLGLEFTSEELLEKIEEEKQTIKKDFLNFSKFSQRCFF